MLIALIVNADNFIISIPTKKKKSLIHTIDINAKYYNII